MSWCVALSMRRNGCQINRGVNAVSQSHCKITGNRKLIHYRSFKWLNFNISAVCVTHTLGNISHCFVKKWTYFQLSCTHQVKISVNICLLFFSDPRNVSTLLIDVNYPILSPKNLSCEMSETHNIEAVFWWCLNYWKLHFHTIRVFNLPIFQPKQQMHSIIIPPK